MKNIKFTLLACSTLLSSVVIAAPLENQTEMQAYGLYSLYHSQEQNPNNATFVKNYTADYADLFKTQKQVNQLQYVQFEQARLEPILKQRREMSLKQAHVRFGVLNTNKDDKITLKEYQEIGLKTFDQFDKNQDGLISAEDAKLESTPIGTHDGFRMKSPLSMPMAGNVNEFIQMYANNNKTYVTLGDYLTHRDQQFVLTDTNKDLSLSEDEYVGEFTQRYDEHLAQARKGYREIFDQQFLKISHGKATIQEKDIKAFATNVAKEKSLKK
ncbi:MULTISPECIES: hypothetical protein [unclassified Acinetobacter]|uniref:hypothetical protein n=1 Tax=unclassified Acinetobacter TaxID=196816 RepID=UPI00190C12DD|nr:MULTISPECIES: hypothetical protein [unclassified Acinetobacter]MBK0063804.1 hypothetical protein [Acinetobacter sp. S55]MBK0066907.1 hypothetical protein [Acinetobacter sp. S54]